MSSSLWEMIHEARVKTGQAQAAHESALAMLEAIEWDTVWGRVDERGALWIPHKKNAGEWRVADMGKYAIRRIDTPADPE